MTAPVTAFGVVEWDAPLVNPWPQGLFTVVTWAEETPPLRWLEEGVRIWPHNFEHDGVGYWGGPMCGEPGSSTFSESLLKEAGLRSAPSEPFAPVVVYSVDECGPDAANRSEIPARAQQNLRLQEQIMVERAFTDRLIADTDAIGSVSDVRAAIGYLENELARTNTVGVIHAEPAVASEEWGLVIGNGAMLRSPLGHRWVFGGGYVDVLNGLMVATSPVFGLRSEVMVTAALDEVHDRYIAIAERTFVVGYEKLVAAVTFGP